MRSWESEPRPSHIGGRADSQDRMDLKDGARIAKLALMKDEGLTSWARTCLSYMEPAPTCILRPTTPYEDTLGASGGGWSA